jgi:DMSO/TMAO reductase YedYZ heme-binding membrane subunit
MPDWINNTHANYVLAAYAIALLILLGLALVSWRAWQCHTKEWHRIIQNDENDTQ